MKAGFYSRLAADGLRKNKRLYLPYILVGSIMVMMYYILLFLGESPALGQMSGGGTLRSILPLGSRVIAVFSFLFLFYANSFLLRQRNREFGLYNILGMDKGNIGRMMLWESGMAAAASVISGLALGISLSKAAEAGLLNIIGMDVDYRLSIGGRAMGQSVLVYAGIYLLLLLYSLIRVRCLKPVALLCSNQVGEKPPKANRALALLGVLILGAAYYISVSTRSPLSAFALFFAAVVMVIAATYLLFIAGSVALCKILQKNPDYYYSPRHFVAVSSMVYRMKRNGAGLASICILSTMVLVMISASGSLYIGAEDSLLARYPYSLELRADYLSLESFGEGDFAVLREVTEDIPSKKDVREYRSAHFSGFLEDGDVTTDPDSLEAFGMDTYDHVFDFGFYSLEDYNRIMGTEETLEEGECLLCCVNTEYDSDRLTINGSSPLRVKKILTDFFHTAVLPCVYVVVNDLESYIRPLLTLAAEQGDSNVRLVWRYAFRTDLSPEENIAAAAAMTDRLQNISIHHTADMYSAGVSSRDSSRADFYETYGGLFSWASCSVWFLCFLQCLSFIISRCLRAMRIRPDLKLCRRWA